MADECGDEGSKKDSNGGIQSFIERVKTPKPDDGDEVSSRSLDRRICLLSVRRGCGPDLSRKFSST